MRRFTSSRKTDKYARYSRVSGINDTMESGVSSFSLAILLCISFFPAGLRVKNMIPAETNKEVAGYTIAELLAAVPIRFGLRSFAVRVALCLLEERVGVGMMYVFPKTARCSPVQYSPHYHRQPAQPWFIHALTRGVLVINWTAHRWLLRPRIYPSFLVKIDLPKPTGETCTKLYLNK